MDKCMIQLFCENMVKHSEEGAIKQRQEIDLYRTWTTITWKVTGIII